MKLDAFEQYIHDQYQGLEVAPPPAVETAVMGRLTRRKWARRVSGAALALAVGAGAVWGWSERAVPSDYAPVVAVEGLPELEPYEEVAVVVDAPVDAPVAVPEVREESPVVSRPDRVDPLPNRSEFLPLEVASVGAPTLQSTPSEFQLWVISAAVEVED